MRLHDDNTHNNASGYTIGSLGAAQATKKPAAAYNCNPKHHCSIWQDTVDRLAMPSSPPLMYVTSRLRYALDHVAQKLDDKLINKKAGENIPGTWKPLQKESYPLFPTRQLNRKAA